MILMVVLQNYHTLFSPPIDTQSCLVQNGAAPVRKEWHSFFGKSLSPYLILWIGHKNTAFGSTYLPLGESVNISLIVPLLEGFGSSFSMPSTSWLHFLLTQSWLHLLINNPPFKWPKHICVTHYLLFFGRSGMKEMQESSGKIENDKELYRYYHS